MRYYYIIISIKTLQKVLKGWEQDEDTVHNIRTNKKDYKDYPLHFTYMMKKESEKMLES